ncbi:MAG: hypothetical protein IJ770_04065 [Alphaproteobacteria bacterium]|nr:hypothetical protein [Alphaproteobacteria bacterium]
MEIEKNWVDEFEILENNGEIGINMIIDDDEPVETAALVYDGRHAAILVRNKKAYILTNILPDVRAKILSVPEVLIIESSEEDIKNSYMCTVSKVDEIPVNDTIPAALGEFLENIKEAFGEEGCAELARKFWGVK